jgi:hypothetical protein
MPGVAPSPVTRRGVVPAAVMPPVRTRLPDSVRKAIRSNLTNELHAMRSGRRYLANHQSDLISSLIDARDVGLPADEIARLRTDALDIGFAPDEIDHLMRVTGWRTGEP